MRITQIICQILRAAAVEAKTASSQDAVLIRVRTDNDLEGLGEADAPPEVVKAIIDAPFSHNTACGLREILIGENPMETERLWQQMYRRTIRPRAKLVSASMGRATISASTVRRNSNPAPAEPDCVRQLMALPEKRTAGDP